jgi:hypothetical protein
MKMISPPRIKAFRWLINVFQPKYFLHGHITFIEWTPSPGRRSAKAVVNVFGYKVLPIETPLFVWQR